MDMTITTVMSAVLVVSLLILLLCPFLKNDYILKKAGPGIPILVLVGIIVRMCIPLEFDYTYDICLDKYFTTVYDVALYELDFGIVVVQVWQAFLFLWFFVAFVLLTKRYFVYRKLMRCIKMAQEVPADELSKCLLEPKDYPELQKIQTVVLPNIAGPFLIGIRQPVIVLPKRKWEREELAYVMEHELLHYRCHDMWLKLAVDILCTLMWWNPMFYILKKELFHFIEVRNDLRITRGMYSEEKKKYMDCLVKSAQNIGSDNQTFAISFSKNNIKELKQRLSLVANEKKKNNFFGAVMGLLLLVLIFATTGVTLEPIYWPPGGKVDLMLPDNTYLVYDGTGYDVYCDFDGTGNYEYAFRDTERDNFLPRTKVFQKGEEIDIN